jgi:hypothetical protein
VELDAEPITDASFLALRQMIMANFIVKIKKSDSDSTEFTGEMPLKTATPAIPCVLTLKYSLAFA